MTRQALNQLRTVSRRREDYVGEWLPEPLLTSPDVADDVELAENVSIAMLTVLETLGPTERAVFVLREVFDVPYDEIAEAVDKSPAAVRQIAHRAREHVAARRPRVSVDRAEQQAGRRAVPRGGRTRATCRRSWTCSRPTSSRSPTAADWCAAPRVGRSSGPTSSRATSSAASRSSSVPFSARPIWVNGQPGIRAEVDGELAGAISFVIDGGRITRVYSIANPEKLGWIDAETELAR